VGVDCTVTKLVGVFVHFFVRHFIIVDYFFPSVFSELIKEGHLYICKRHCLEFVTRKETIYCYSEDERRAAIEN
jgi:DNA gyrase/topoisomerase IV subunit B